MIVDQELDAVIRAGVFRDREHAIHEAIETLFVVRPQLRTEAAVELFRSGEVSLLRAAELAGLDSESFRRVVPRRDAHSPRRVTSPGASDVPLMMSASNPVR